MAVSIASRYRGLEVYDAADSTGAVHPTVAIRRHVPPPTGAVDYRHRVTGVEDIEYLAWRFHGDSEIWWRVADANPTACPLDLRPGDALAVPTISGFGRIDRERVL